jgi:hypothetical protein
MTPEIPTRQHEAGVQRPGYGNPYLLQIARLQEELEAMRQRAEAAEAALGLAFVEVAVPPMGLYQTRVMRMLAERDLTGQQIINALLPHYPNTTDNCLKSFMSQLRRKLPASIAPPRAKPAGWGVSSPYTIPDRPALRAFLASGQMPMARIAA